MDKYESNIKTIAFDKIVASDTAAQMYISNINKTTTFSFLNITNIGPAYSMQRSGSIGGNVLRVELINLIPDPTVTVALAPTPKLLTQKPTAKPVIHRQK